MATAKKSSYIAVELDWLETQISLLKKEVEDILSNLSDRYGPKELPNGKVVEALVSSREDQLKTATIVMEKIPKMLQALDELREKEEAKKVARGSASIPSRMK